MKDLYLKITTQYKYLMRHKSKKEIFTYIVLSTFSLICFLFITILVREDALRSLDFNTTVRLQDNIPVKYDDLFSILSIIGRFEFTFALLALILLVNRKILGALIAIFAFALAHVIEVIGKMTLNQPGPPNMFLRTHFTDFPGLHVHTQASFPSGHSLRIVFIFAVVVYLVLVTKKLSNLGKIGAIILSLGITIAMLVSRVSLGEHWTTDVIGGIFLGASAAFATLVFM